MGKVHFKIHNVWFTSVGIMICIMSHLFVRTNELHSPPGEIESHLNQTLVLACPESPKRCQMFPTVETNLLQQLINTLKFRNICQYRTQISICSSHFHRL